MKPTTDVFFMMALVYALCYIINTHKEVDSCQNSVLQAQFKRKEIDVSQHICAQTSDMKAQCEEGLFFFCLFVWRVLLYISALRSADRFRLQRFSRVGREAAAPSEVCRVGCSCWNVAIVLACLGLLRSLLWLQKQGGSWIWQVLLHHFKFWSLSLFTFQKLWAFEQKKNLLCGFRFGEMVKGCLRFSLGFTLNLLTQTCKMAFMVFPIPLLQTDKFELFKGSWLEISDAPV